MQQQAVLACNNALRLLAAALAAAAAAHALAGSEQSTPPCPRPSPLRRLVTVHLGRSRGAETARAAGLMLVVEIRRRRVQHAMSVCVKRQHGAMPAWAMSASEVLQGELAATACFFWCFLLLLLQALLLHGGTHTSCRVHDTSVSPARGNVLKRARSNKSGLCYSRGKLGQSKASG